MNWRDKLGVFVLTREEINVKSVTAKMHYRHTHPRETPNEKQGAVVTPSPVRSR